MPRAPGRMFSDGVRASADALVGALRAPHTDHDVAESLTHPLHSYPARLHPATARILVELVATGAERAAPVVDPFCGSGTSLVEARAAGLRAIGVDLNPLAVLVPRAQTRAVPRRRAGRRAARRRGRCRCASPRALTPTRATAGWRAGSRPTCAASSSRS